MFDVKETKQKRSKDVLLKRAKAIISSQEIIFQKIIQQKYGEWEWQNISLQNKAKIISQTVCEYCADRVNNKSKFSTASVEKIGDYYRVKYPVSFTKENCNKHEKRLIEATALLLVSLKDANVEEISRLLPTSDEVIIHTSDTLEEIAQEVTQLVW